MKAKKMYPVRRHRHTYYTVHCIRPEALRQAGKENTMANLDEYYLNRWKDITGDDYFDDDFEDDVPDEDDYDDYLFNQGMDDRRNAWERE